MYANRTASVARGHHQRGQGSARCRAAAGDIASPDRALGGLPTDLRKDACPTCLACTDPRLDAMAGATVSGADAAACPTCGQTSLEFGLLMAIEEILSDLHGLARLDAEL